MSKRIPPSQRPERGPKFSEGFLTRLAKAVAYLVAFGVHEKKPPQAIRLFVQTELQKALDREDVQVIDQLLDGEPEPVAICTLPCIFLMVFDNEYDQIDTSNPAIREAISEIVDRMATDFQDPKVLAMLPKVVQR